MYFIRDCNEHIIGKQNGYDTYMDACKVQSDKTTDVHKELWCAYAEKQMKDENWIRIGSIRQ
jgi:hypothetical protein